MKKFQKHPVEPLKLDYDDDEEVFVDSAVPDGNKKQSKNESDSKKVSSVTKGNGTMSEDYVDSGIPGESLLNKENEKVSAESEEDTFPPLLSRQPSWGLRRNRSSKKKRDYFR